MNTEERAFVRIVRTHYKARGRTSLPWRHTVDPYRIAVSEIMLQQTQVDRVIPKYEAFLKAFPTARALATAPLADVLRQWSGLGYNRRAKYLHQMAHIVAKEKFPVTMEKLMKLPGIGPYTAGAISAFAFNQPFPIIETNIRTAYIHHFFKDDEAVSDKELYVLVLKTMDTKNPREWYWALMDYGAHLKRLGNRAHRVSAHYAKQSVFKGSRRQARGAILRELLNGPVTFGAIVKKIGMEKGSAQSILGDLIREGLVTKTGRMYGI